MTIYKFILHVPIIKTLVYITNSYVYQGDENATRRFAGPWLWLKVFFVPMFLSCILTSITVLPMTVNFYKTRELIIFGLSEFSSKPGALIVSVVPNLLGFGIGIYALLFSLNATFIKQFENQIKDKKAQDKKAYGSALMLNSDMAFPITILIFCISVAVFQQVFPTVASLLVATWVIFWYSIFMLVEIVGVLFGLVDNSLLDKTIDSKEVSD